MSDQYYFKNGNILTMEKNRRCVEAILIDGGRIVKVGTEDEIDSCRRPDAKIVDLGGKTLMPGFIDAHLHFLWGAQYLDIVGLRDAKTFADVTQKLEHYAKAYPQREWITGLEFSYGYPDMEGREFHRSMLDDVVNDRPVFFYSGMAHAAWVNTKALELAGIDHDTPDPENGRIVRDENGEPTGWLIEQAVKLVERRVPKPNDNAIKEMLQKAIYETNRLGITRVQSAGFDDDLLQHLQDLRDKSRLSLRYTLSTVCPPPRMTDEVMEIAKAKARRFHDDYLDARVMKFFIDGVLESHTGYMPQGYADKPEEKGTILWNDKEFQHAVQCSQGAGLQVWAHAIGQGAISFALDGYSSDLANSRLLRPRVEHVEIPSEIDLDRFKDINAIASMQPAMIYPQDQWMGMVGIWEKRVGKDSMKLAFPIRSLLDRNVEVAFGTDWPIVDLNPFIGIRNAVLRQSLDGEPPKGWVPEQRISVEEALYAYTLGAAYACHREEEEGSIAEGKLADLIVLSDNPLEIEAHELGRIAVQATFVGGRPVYGSI